MLPASGLVRLGAKRPEQQLWLHIILQEAKSNGLRADGCCNMGGPTMIGGCMSSSAFPLSAAVMEGRCHRLKDCSLATETELDTMHNITNMHNMINITNMHQYALLCIILVVSTICTICDPFNMTEYNQS